MEGGGRLMAGGHFKIFKQVTGTKKKDFYGRNGKWVRNNQISIPCSMCPELGKAGQMAQPHTAGGPTKESRCFLSSGTNWGNLWRWGRDKAIGQSPFYIVPTATSPSGHISCESLVFVSKQLVLGVEQTNIMFGFSLFVVLIVLSICGQASVLGFDIPETYVYTRDATAVR